jgi:iron(III) transport system permease protein
MFDLRRWDASGYFLCMAALAFHFLWIPYKALKVSARKIPSDQIEAARLFKLSNRRIWKGIQSPVVMVSVVLGGFIVFLLSLWDVETLVLIYSPGAEPLSLRIYQLLHYGYEHQVAALCLGLMMIGIIPLMVVGCLSRKQFTGKL